MVKDEIFCSEIEDLCLSVTGRFFESCKDKNNKSSDRQKEQDAALFVLQEVLQKLKETDPPDSPLSGAYCNEFSYLPKLLELNFLLKRAHYHRACSFLGKEIANFWYKGAAHYGLIAILEANLLTAGK